MNESDHVVCEKTAPYNASCVCQDTDVHVNSCDLPGDYASAYQAVQDPLDLAHATKDVAMQMTMFYYPQLLVAAIWVLYIIYYMIKSGTQYPTIGWYITLGPVNKTKFLTR